METQSFSKNEWKPEPKQELFLSIPTTIKEAFYGGGAGSGKSDVLLLYGIVHRWHEHPKFKQVFMRRTYPELRNEIIPRSRELYRKFGATLNKTEMCWTFPRPDQYGGTGGHNEGAMIFLGHCENEDDVHQYDTMQINLFTPDELTSITEWIYLYIGFQRVRSPVPELPAIIRAAGMPGGIGHTWTYKRFIKPAPKGGKIIVGRGGNKRIYIHSTLEDNKHIDPTYKQSLQGITIEAERKAKLLGDWDAYQGQVFDEFRDRKFEDEPDNAVHVIPEFEIPQWWPRIVVGDWGFAAMTWIGYAAISPSKRVYIYREQYWVKTKIAEWAPHVKLYIDKECPRLIRFCKSAGQERGQEHTIQQQIEDELGQSIELSNNTPGSRIAGKSLIHEYLRWKPKEINPTEIGVYNEDYAMWTQPRAFPGGGGPGERSCQLTKSMAEALGQAAIHAPSNRCRPRRPWPGRPCPWAPAANLLRGPGRYSRKWSSLLALTDLVQRREVHHQVFDHREGPSPKGPITTVSPSRKWRMCNWHRVVSRSGPWAGR